MSSKDQDLWNDFAETYDTFIKARMNFFKNVTDRVEILRHGLRYNTALAFDVMQYIEDHEKQALLPDLLPQAISVHGLTHLAQEHIWSLPKEWLVENIEQHAEPILTHNDYSDYWGLLELYFHIDHDLTRRLAERASKSDAYDIREAGEDYLARLQDS